MSWPFAQARRRRWRVAMALGSAGLSLLLLAVAGAATCRPSWYQPRAIDRARLKADKHDFVHLLDAIGTALNAGETIEFVLAEDQLNRWLAARGEVWPGLTIEIEGLDNPHLTLLNGNRVRLAATVTGRPIELVFWAIARWELEAEQVVIRLESVRCGALPVPRGRVLDPIRQWLAQRPDESARVAEAAIALRNRWVWENGKRPFRLKDLEISGGVARVSLEPLRDGP